MPWKSAVDCGRLLAQSSKLAYCSTSNRDLRIQACVDSMRVQPSSSVLVKRVGDETILVDLATDRIYSLNLTATCIWESLAAGACGADMALRLSERFAIEPEAAEAAVDELVAQFRREGLVRDSDAG